LHSVFVGRDVAAALCEGSAASGPLSAVAEGSPNPRRASEKTKLEGARTRRHIQRQAVVLPAAAAAIARCGPPRGGNTHFSARARTYGRVRGQESLCGGGGGSGISSLCTTVFVPPFFGVPADPRRRARATHATHTRFSLYLHVGLFFFFSSRTCNLLRSKTSKKQRQTVAYKAEARQTQAHSHTRRPSLADLLFLTHCVHYPTHQRPSPSPSPSSSPSSTIINISWN